MNKIFLSGLALTALSAQAVADTPSFDFVEAGFIGNISGPASFNGFEIKGKLTITDSVYFNGGYTNADFDGSLGRGDTDILTLGLGYKTDISDFSVLFAQADYVRADNSINGFGSGNGYQVGFGIRSNRWNKVELKAAGFYRDLDGTATFFQFGTAYNFTDVAGAYLDIETDFDDSSFGVGFRYSF